jgi:hypothetical protein
MKLEGSQIPLGERATPSAEVTDLQSETEGLLSPEVNNLEETALRDDLSSDHPERVIVWIVVFFLVEVAIALWRWLT